MSDDATRMELEVTTFHLPSAIDDAMTLIRERAGQHGIALSKRFAELHGGSIRVESILGKGSTFILTLAEQDLAGTNR